MKVLVAALTFLPVFAHASGSIMCDSTSTGLTVSAVTMHGEGSALASSIKVTRNQTTILEVPIAQVVNYKNDAEEIYIKALDKELNEQILFIQVKTNPGAPYPDNEDVYWGKMKINGSNVGLRCTVE